MNYQKHLTSLKTQQTKILNYVDRNGDCRKTGLSSELPFISICEAHDLSSKIIHEQIKKNENLEEKNENLIHTSELLNEDNNLLVSLNKEMKEEIKKLKNENNKLIIEKQFLKKMNEENKNKSIIINNSNNYNINILNNAKINASQNLLDYLHSNKLMQFDDLTKRKLQEYNESELVVNNENNNMLINNKKRKIN